MLLCIKNLLGFSCLFSSSYAAFVHPGMLHTADDFTRVIAKVEAEEEPWITGWEKITASGHASASYTATPSAMIYRGSDGTNSQNYPHLYNDIAAAYQLALRWKISGDTSYADTAVAVLNAWGSELTGISGSSDKYLASGIYGYEFANAAEIMRDYDGWATDDFDTFVSMMVKVFYPMNHRFLIDHNGCVEVHYFANWDLCNIASMEMIGILSDNTTMYQEAIDYFKTGAGMGALNNYLWVNYTVDGQRLAEGQEAGRDQGHAMLDLALVGPLALAAYNQGDDLFALEDSQILAGAEYAAKYNLGYDVPYTAYSNDKTDFPVISNSSRGDIRPIWELLYNHYGVLKGQNVTWTKQYRDLVVSDGDGAEGGGGNYGTTSGGYDQLVKR
ncbi:MAG: hypothetical protein M1834_009260 [Cirrosporium novae-zelandiae]|nr:MAG: hypothetical protein M1834_009260 [Cirrosporium novae-zelandiae]